MLSQEQFLLQSVCMFPNIYKYMYFAHLEWNLRTTMRKTRTIILKCVRHYEQTVEKQSVFEIKATNTDNKCVKR